MTQIIYSYALNKRHTAYAFATSSVRLGTIMGMHLNIPDHQMRDREAREHRTRLWWSAYILDRTCASTLGHPPTIYDEDIQVDLPSSEGLSEASKSDFGDAEYFLRSIELARLSTQVVSSIYSRRKHQIPFSQRVQSSLRDLTKWSESLPDHLQLHAVGAAQVSPNHIIFLHLTFNQVRTYSPTLAASNVSSASFLLQGQSFFMFFAVTKIHGPTRQRILEPAFQIALLRWRKLAFNALGTHIVCLRKHG